MSQELADAVVVGAGASGGVVAKELATAGMKVVLLERGPAISPAQYRLHDELASASMGVPATDYPLPDTRHPREFRYRDEPAFRTVLPGGGNHGFMGGVVGGGELTYAGLMWRRPPIDFRMKSEYGQVPGTTMEDWPISYDDLEPFYEKAEYEFGVSGEGGVNPFEGRRKKPFPLPPIDLCPGDLVMKAAAQRLGYHPFIVPLGIATQQYLGRDSCIGHPCCNTFICEIGAKATSANTVIPVALKTGNCRLVTEAVVKEISLDGRGRPNGIRYFDKNGTLVEQSARVVILAASATETPRLLLNSKSRWFLKGLGNSNNWVGRNLMGHIHPRTWGVFDKVTNEGFGPGPGLGIDDFYGKLPGLAGGAVMYTTSLITPLAFCSTRPAGAPTWGKEFKKYQRDDFHRVYRITAPVEDLPVFENRVEVSPTVKDAWGIPVARISHTFHPQDLERYGFFQRKQTELLREAGARDIVSSPPYKGRVDVHQNGTCRMGKDPKNSVVNRHGQSHEIDNLFIVDGSVFATSGGRNPALTIHALAYLFSDYIKKEWRSGAWRK